MVALMCCCCNSPKYLTTEFIQFDFSASVDYIAGEVTEYRFENSIFLFNTGSGIVNSYYSSQCNMEASTGYKSSPPADNPESGSWTEGFLVCENGVFYKTQDIPPIDNAILSCRSLLSLNSSFRYAFFYGSAVSPFAEPILVSDSFDDVYSAFQSYALSSYGECASKFGSSYGSYRGSIAVQIPTK